MITVEYFKRRLPEWGNTDPLVIEEFIYDAESIMGTDIKYWGNQRSYDMGQLYLAAHQLQRWTNVQDNPEGGNINPKIITGMQVGDVSVTRGGVNVMPQNFTQDELNTTWYGLQYLKVLESRPRPPMIALL